MHKKLDVGSILFTYHEPRYDLHKHRTGDDKYVIEFKALHVQNRRERSNGAYVPKTLIPTLEKLGIKHQEGYYSGDMTCAVGCRTYVYYKCNSNMPYPTPEQIKEARRQFELKLSNGTASNEGTSLIEVDFVQKFKEKKMSNKDAVFSLQKSLENYVCNETHFAS